MNCSTCKFWAHSLLGGTRECIKRAPYAYHSTYEHVDYGRQDSTTTFWPRTLATDWCGDHEPRKDDST